MNSMYGRLGLHTGATQSALLPNHLLDKYAKIFNIIFEIIFKEGYSLINYSSKNGKETDSKLIKEYAKALILRTNVALASAVTAYSRMIINGHKLAALNNGANLYYSDTDSMVIDKELDPSLVDSAKLGYLKLEHTIEEGIFPLPKVYYLKTSEGEVTKAKGYSGKSPPKATCAARGQP
jgi:hypothetical protein